MVKTKQTKTVQLVHISGSLIIFL